MIKRHGFTQNEANFFSTAYYIFTDAGALTAGFGTLWLARRGIGVHASRRLVFLIGALLAALCIVVPLLPPMRWLLIGVLLLVGFGSLGMFPVYYSFSQDLTVRNQGKVTGALGAFCWGGMFLWQIAIGQWVHHMKSYTLPFIIAGTFAPVRLRRAAAGVGADAGTHEGGRAGRGPEPSRTEFMADEEPIKRSVAAIEKA